MVKFRQIWSHWLNWQKRRSSSPVRGASKFFSFLQNLAKVVCSLTTTTATATTATTTATSTATTKTTATVAATAATTTEAAADDFC